MDEDDHQSTAGRRRNRAANTTASARSLALERLKALRKGEARPSYDIKIDDRIYDTVDEDEYQSLVAKRREEFSDFIVGEAGDGYIDDGEEEDWTKATAGFSSDDDGDDGGDGRRKEKKDRKERPERKRVSANSAALSAAAANLMGKQRISSMFTSSVFKKRGEEKTKGNLVSDSVVDDVIAEFSPDYADRERRRRVQSQHLRFRGGASISNAAVLKQHVPVEISKKVEGNYSSNDCVDGISNYDARDCSLDLVPIKEDVEVEEQIRDDLISGVEIGGGLKGDKNGAGNGDDGCGLENVIDAKADVKLKEGGEKVFAFNAKIKEEKVQTYSAAFEWETMCAGGGGGGDGSVANEVPMVAEDKSEFVVEDDGSLPFYIIDAYEEIYGSNAGNVYLFGKVKAGNAYHSCCVVVKNMQRCLYAIPNESVFPSEVVLKLEKDLADAKISLQDFRTRIHEVASGVKLEIAKQLSDLNVGSFSMTPVKRNYAFDRSDIPSGENYVLKINYSFKHPPLPSDLKGENFGAVLGTHASALELFLVKRKIKGPSWLSISRFLTCSRHQRVSWCKFEITVDCPKNVRVSASTKNTAQIPPLIVTAINVKTIVNEKSNVNEIVSASITSCSRTKIDAPMSSSEWKTSGVLSHFTAVRKLEGGIFPLRFTTEAKRKNSKTVELKCPSSERELLQLLIIQMYWLDSDILVGHNISGFDLDVLLHRAQACRVPNSMWSKIGRLKRSTMPKLTKGSSVFGSGASPGIMSCIVGRLLCDTFLCSRDLLTKEVSFSLTHLAKSQLNKERKEIAPNDIPQMYQTAESLFNLVECNQTDAWLSLELMFHLNVLPLTRQLTNISGHLWGKTLQGGRAQRVEYLLLHAFHAKKFMVPDKYPSRGKDNKLAKRRLDNAGDIATDDAIIETEGPHEDQGKAKKGPAYAGGLVLEPKKGLYDKFVLLLDFNSLYPSIIQEYNICFTTVERDLDGPVPRLPSSEKTGVLPELLKNLVERRRMVKSWLKEASGLKYEQFDIQQRALKLTANSCNSIMIYTGLDDYDKATAIARKVIQEVNKKYKCLEIDLDGLYKRILLLKKKKYAAVKVYKNRDQLHEEKERKGLDIVRRDWSSLSKKVGDFCLSHILSGGSCEDVGESTHNHLTKVQEDMRNGQIALEKYIITKSLTKPPEAYPDVKNQPHVQVALRLKQNGYFTGCSAGDIIPYIICYEQGPGSGTSGGSAGIALMARHPDELKKRQLYVDD